eukprot:SAG11_NODE_7198_length_1179_cov_1.262037_1_plen_137_part_00
MAHSTDAQPDDLRQRALVSFAARDRALVDAIGAARRATVERRLGKHPSSAAAAAEDANADATAERARDDLRSAATALGWDADADELELQDEPSVGCELKSSRSLNELLGPPRGLATHCTVCSAHSSVDTTPIVTVA